MGAMDALAIPVLFMGAKSALWSVTFQMKFSDMKLWHCAEYALGAQPQSSS